MRENCKPGLQAQLSWDYELVLEVKASHMFFVSLFKTESPSGVCALMYTCVCGGLFVFIWFSLETGSLTSLELTMEAGLR